MWTHASKSKEDQEEVFFFLIFPFMCMSVCVPNACGTSRDRKGTGDGETGDVDGYKQPCGCWELYLFFKRPSSINCWASFPVPRVLPLNYVHMYVSVGGNVHVTTGALGSQKSHVLKWELQVVVSLQTGGLGTEFGISVRAAGTFDCLQCRSIIARLSFHPQGLAFMPDYSNSWEPACLSLCLPSYALKVVQITLGVSAPHVG